MNAAARKRLWHKVGGGELGTRQSKSMSDLERARVSQQVVACLTSEGGGHQSKGMNVPARTRLYSYVCT